MSRKYIRYICCYNIIYYMANYATITPIIPCSTWVFFFTNFLKIIRYLEIPTGKSFFPLNQFNPYLFFLAELNITRWPSELLLSKIVDACRLRSRCRRRCCKLLPTAYPSLQLRAGLILYVKFS